VGECVRGGMETPGALVAVFVTVFVALLAVLIVRRRR
jgi:hypothetical protein